MVKTLEEYDYIIFDSLLALFLADTNLLSNKVDFTLLVISLFKVERNLINAAINNIRLSNGNILGVISINSKKINHLVSYEYGSYRYGYEYLDENKIYKNKLKLKISIFAFLYKNLKNGLIKLIGISFYNH